MSNTLEFRGRTASGRFYSMIVNDITDVEPIDYIYLWNFIHMNTKFTTLDFRNHLSILYERHVSDKYVSLLLSYTNIPFVTTDSEYKMYFSPVFSEPKPEPVEPEPHQKSITKDLLKSVFLDGKTKREAKVILAQEDRDLTMFETLFEEMIVTKELIQISLETDPVFRTNRENMYYSESKQKLISISGMATPYLLNAIRKKYEWKDISELLNQIPFEDTTYELTCLLGEFLKRMY